jgi:hypothetical protein
MIRKQQIPVSTIPMGADIYADGAYVGVTPTTVELARNRDHILNLSKTGYRQEDVLVTRQQQTDQMLLKAVSQGLSTGQFFNDAAWGVQSGVASISSQQQTGEAYVLQPGAVSVTLVPSQGVATGATVGNVAGVGIATLTTDDRRELGHILETGASGNTMSWTNNATKSAYFVTPDAPTQGTPPVRYFTIVTRAGEQTETERFPAHRVDMEVWEIGLPPPSVQPKESASIWPSLATVVGVAVIAGAASAGSHHTVHESQKSHTTTSADGSTTKTTTKSTKVSVGVNPVGFAQSIGSLMDEKNAVGFGH